MNYLQSSAIDVFPAGFRGTGYANSKLTTEQNLTQMQLLSSESKNNNFIFKRSDSSNNSNVIIGIQGYIFSISENILGSLISITPNPVYAHIKLRELENSNASNNYGNVLCPIGEDYSSVTCLDTSEDINSNFIGLGFDNVSSDDIYSIQITDISGNILESNFRLASNEIRDTVSEKSIYEDFNTKKVTAENINKINIQKQNLDTADVINVKFTGDLNLPENSDRLKSILVQETPGNSSWLEYSSENIPNNIIARDQEGNAEVNNLTANSINQIPIDKSSEYDILIGSATQENLKIAKGKKLDIKSDVTIETNSSLSITGAITIAGKIDIKNNSAVTINKNLNILTETSIGSSNSAYSGSVTIRSSGTQSTTIIGPANGTITLPANHTSNNNSVLTQNSSIPSWLQISSESTANTAVSRDANGEAKFENVTINSIKSANILSTDTNGKLTNKISLAAGARSSKAYDIKLDSANKLYVDVPWTDNDTQCTITTGVDQGWFFYSNKNNTQGELASSKSVILTNLTTSGSPTFKKVTAGSFVSTSDLRLKENVKDFKYKKSILDLKVKTFDFKNGEKNQIGCIAQDLAEIYPELVETRDDGYLAIKETKLVYLLIEEIRNLKEEINKLKK